MRVLFVDDHPTIRAGLATVFRSEPGMLVVGAASRASEAVEQARLTSPDVVLVDYQLPDEDGLTLCQQLKSLDESPSVLVYSGYADGRLAIAAMVAGADGVLGKSAPADDLIEAVRTVARGGNVFPPRSPHVMEEAAARIPEDDLPILGMMSNGTPRREVAKVMRLSERELAARAEAIVNRIKARPARSRGGA